jgi:hypothetical protein
MSNKDKSYSSINKILRSQFLANFHLQNPSKQLEGPRGVTPSSTLTEMKQYQGVLISSVFVDLCDSLSDIATSSDGIVWTLNANTTISSCLTIPSGSTLIINTLSLTISVSGIITNNGTIQVQGIYSDNGATDGSIINNGTLTNNGLITILASAGTFSTSGTFINNGTFTNNWYSYNFGITTNNGTINNVGSGPTSFHLWGSTFTNAVGANLNISYIFDIGRDDVIVVPPAILYNYGTITITDPSTFTISNQGTFYNRGILTSPTITDIDISTVATLSTGIWTFSASFTISASQRLIIPTNAGCNIPIGITITNFGEFTFGTADNGAYINGIFVNYGTFTNNGYEVVVYGIFRNYGTIINSSGNRLFLAASTSTSAFYNTGILTNSGIFSMLINGIYTMTFYNYAGGQFNNIGSFSINSPNIFNNANGGACGIATLTNTGTVTGTISTGCPP